MPLVIPSTGQPSICNGRLTLTTGVPVPVADVIGATTVYFTPHTGHVVYLYDGALWVPYTFSELSVALGTLSNATNYDIFLWDNAGTLTLTIGPAWSSATARGTGAGTTELVTVNGVRLNAVAISGGPAVQRGRYVGSFRTTATTTTEDSVGGVTTQVGGKLFLFNETNRVMRIGLVIDTADSWSYTTGTIRQAQAAAGNQVAYLSGDAATVVRASVNATVSVRSGATRIAYVGVGLDSTTTVVGTRTGAFASAAVDLIYVGLRGDYAGQPGLGYHYCSWNELGQDGLCVFQGDNFGVQSGLRVEVTL